MNCQCRNSQYLQTLKADKMEQKSKKYDNGPGYVHKCTVGFFQISLICNLFIHSYKHKNPFYRYHNHSNNKSKSKINLGKNS